MFGKKFYYNGQEISTIDTDYIVWLTGIDWVNSMSSNQKTNVSGYHGVKSSPTYLRGRQITIEGGISADTRAKTLDGMYYLRDLFALRPLTSSQVVPFTIQDEQDRLWTTNVKIVTPLEFDEGDFDTYDGTVRKWRVILFADDARFSATTPNTENGVEGDYWGFNLWDDDNILDSWDTVTNSIECTAFGMEISEAIITLTVTDTVSDYIKVINVTTGAVFKFTIDTPLNAGSVIIINSKDRKIRIDGADKTANRLPGSVRPIVQGTNNFVIFDVDEGVNGTDFTVAINFYDILV